MKFLLIFLLIVQTAAAQNKLYDHNNINWVQSQNTIKIKGKTSAHLEYNWRRVNGLRDWMQSLIRVGVNQKIDDKLLLHIGYAYAYTYVFGDYPIAANGPFPERRLYEQINYKSNYQRLQLLHRLRVEQRWNGVMNANTGNFERWNFTHRFRYMLKGQFPINEKVFLSAMDEIFIGAGKNLGVNIFDQNRVWLSTGVKLGKNVSAEIGYFNLIIQQGRLVNNKLVIQKNNGILLSVSTSF